MNRRLLTSIMILSCIVLTIALLKLHSTESPLAKVPLRIRIVGLTTNISPMGCEWHVAVPKPRSDRAAVLFWSVQIEETTNINNQGSQIVLRPGEQELMSITLDSHEEGILTWWYGRSVKPGQRYRVIGSYFEPHRIEERLRSWCWHVPTLGRLLPQPKAAFATSEWFEVTTMMKPSGKDSE